MMDQANTDPIIVVDGLTKAFKNIVAVNAISFTVGRGETFAFLGPNGAGKSTTIKMLITLLAPTGGGGTVNGIDFVRYPAEVRRVIGYIPQMISVDGTLTAWENLTLMAKLYDIPRAERATRVDEVLSLLRLETFRNSLVRTFSGGMVRKLEVGQAILHHPPVLFLDEPTVGLDPVSKQNVWELLLELRRIYGTTIFFSTHDMEEADQVSQRVAIINAGAISIVGSSTELKEKTGEPNATLEDAFIFFTGSQLQETGNIREIRRNRDIARKRG
jgi:ABC-2 type transport system ATP-binding protein